jgi:hypothetical protein
MSVKAIAANSAESVSYWALTAAKIANWIASGPAGWATAALIVAAIGATVAIIA